MPTSWSVYQHYTAIVICTAAMHPAGHVKMAVSETRRKLQGGTSYTRPCTDPPSETHRKDLHDPCTFVIVAIFVRTYPS